MSNKEEGCNEETASADDVCANCGIAEVDDIKLKLCDGGCDFVKYCSDRCCEMHRPYHVGECRRRAAKLHDDKLFRQPDESHRGECPICFLPLPLDINKCIYKACCSNVICDGCLLANFKNNGGDRCPFCRETAPDEEESIKRTKKRMKANDPAAFCYMGTILHKEGDRDEAFKYFAKGAELGDVEAHCRIGLAYAIGEDVERDVEKYFYHLEKAAIGGHFFARHDLGVVEEGNGNVERAVKHYMIAANLGYEGSMKRLWPLYSAGHITKEDLDATLRTHQAAINEMKSSQREEAEMVRRQTNNNPEGGEEILADYDDVD